MPETAGALDPAEELAAWLMEFSDLGFCLTLTRDRITEDVIRAYGIDPAQARLLPLDDFLEVDPGGTGADEGTVIRFGHSGVTAFSLEYIGTTGGQNPVLAHLCSHTETIALTATADGMTSVKHARDGVPLSSFEPDAPQETRSGPGPHTFAELLQRVIAERATDDEADRRTDLQDALRLVHDQYGDLPDPATLSGPLLTAYLPDAP
ncbi:DUF6461 domain-containing protein [Streptomyces sp. LHD-70]|uniref:DUF6461 domain-containing protein n=1 Tax=Streptomyces sp. LHD-70 TaxID=3072140 RepID=UPI00280FA3B1|nr:DUF6461 domain-containing protein [Streptomyces sp. LHD-70]MDQ8707988.1 DUF6461 domain-containing protein [Streptomyces sp. LHD-70]